MTEQRSLYDKRKYKRQLRGWLSYAFASEVFVIVSLTLFLPICLEQFARDNGYLLPDLTNKCSAVQPMDASEDRRCVVKLAWLWIDTASFSLYVNSMSVALQALTVISLSGIADHPPHRKRLLLGFAFFGAVSATLFFALPSSSPLWPLSALLAIFANVGFGVSVVAMNAYLPTLAQQSEEVVKKLEALQNTSTPGISSETPDINVQTHSDAAQEPLLPRDETIPELEHPEGSKLRAEYNSTLSTATSRISAMGIAIGYGAGIILLILSLIPVTKLGGSTFSLRLAIGSSGIWWAAFSIPSALWLPSTSSAKESSSVEWDDDPTITQNAEEQWSIPREIINAWKRLGGMLRPSEIKKLKNTFKYLAAWFLLSDGFTTITSTAVLFGKTVLHMPPSSLIIIGVVVPSAGIAGSIVWPMIQRRLGWSNLKVLVVLVMMISVIPAYGCTGFLPFFQKGDVKFGGLTTPEELYVLAVYFGLVYGAFQGYARAFYSELIPPGEEARWYGLFSITDKSSSFIGPLVVGLIADTTGNIRYAFFFLVLMVWSAVPILLMVDIEKGRSDAKTYVYRGRR